MWSYYILFLFCFVSFIYPSNGDPQRVLNVTQTNHDYNTPDHDFAITKNVYKTAFVYRSHTTEEGTVSVPKRVWGSIPLRYETLSWITLKTFPSCSKDNRLAHHFTAIWFNRSTVALQLSKQCREARTWDATGNRARSSRTEAHQPDQTLWTLRTSPDTLDRNYILKGVKYPELWAVY